VCAAHKEKLFGFRLHLLITWRGVIHDFVLAAANHHDLTMEEELLAPYQNLEVVEDKAYIDDDRRQQLKAERNIAVYTPKRRNQKEYSAGENGLINHIRQLVETVGGQLVEVFHIGWIRVRSFTGLLLSIYAKLTAHTLGIFLNKLWGREWLHIKELAF
jgi:IS5 family transposase